MLVYQKGEAKKNWKFDSSRIHRFRCFRPKSIRYGVWIYLVANFPKFCHNWQKYLLIPLEHTISRAYNCIPPFFTKEVQKFVFLFLFVGGLQCVGPFCIFDRCLRNHLPSSQNNSCIKTKHLKRALSKEQDFDGNKNYGLWFWARALCEKASSVSDPYLHYAIVYPIGGWSSVILDFLKGNKTLHI